MKTYSSAVSSMGPHLSLPKGERKREQESVAETSAATDSIKLSVNDRQRRLLTSTIVNAPLATTGTKSPTNYVKPVLCYRNRLH
jgi:hypothetical protein